MAIDIKNLDGYPNSLHLFGSGAIERAFCARARGGQSGPIATLQIRVLKISIYKISEILEFLRRLQGLKQRQGTALESELVLPDDRHASQKRLGEQGQSWEGAAARWGTLCNDSN